ncbi:MAG: hypothetical protein ACYTF7_05915 [Planctomycetota bacterium]|jgi:hypothetical protein
MHHDPALRFMPGEDTTLPPDEEPPPSGGGEGADPPPDPEADSGNTDDSPPTIASLTARIRELEAQIASLQQTSQQTTTKHLIENALIRAGVIDIDTATLLLERLLDESDDQLDETTIDRLVGALRNDKPYLFASDPSPAGAALASASAEDPLLHAARLASNNADRASLLRYLRLRRTND